MTDLSNKTLAVLIGLVLAVSLVGTWAVLNKVNVGVAGAFSTTGQGTAYADVGEQASISMKAAIINFSTVQADDNKDSATQAIAGQRYFAIENDGTVKVNVTESGTALWSGASKVNSDFQIYAADNESSSAVSYLGSQGSPLNITGSEQKLIDNMGFTLASDLVNVFIKIHVPLDEAAGAKSSTLTFTASKA
jgi:hypothetical protein